MSINIDGRAGTGKSYFINALQKEMKKINITFKSLAYTNKACRIIDGTTIHKFIKQLGKKINDINYDYIIVDEISMVPEIFYKFVSIIKRLNQ
jgi:DNA replication protein DnaC